MHPLKDADSYRQTPWHRPAPPAPPPPEHTEYPKHMKNVHGHAVMAHNAEQEAHYQAEIDAAKPKAEHVPEPVHVAPVDPVVTLASPPPTVPEPPSGEKVLEGLE